MELELEERVELIIMLGSFFALTYYFKEDYLAMAKQLLIWIFATSTTLLVVARIKKYIINSLRKKIEESNDDEVKKA